MNALIPRQPWIDKILRGLKVEVNMCETGINVLIELFKDAKVGSYKTSSWVAVADGFGEHAGAPRFMEEDCPTCGQPVALVKRTLESVAYNLPDAAVYQRLKSKNSCIALGLVIPGKTTMKWQPEQEVRRRYQGMLWSVYQVAFVDVVDDVPQPFEPLRDWGHGEVLQDLGPLATELTAALKIAMREKMIPVYKSTGKGDSRGTEQRMWPIVSPILRERGYEFTAGDMQTAGIHSCWWSHHPDAVYMSSSGNTLGIEVKVTEDWDHPVNQPLADLLNHNAVLNVRVGKEDDRRSFENRRLSAEAETLLSATGRAAFIGIA
jgi:hypothetical protein